MLKDFFSVLSEILLNPILFFSDIKDEDWYQRPVTIAGIASLILSFAVTISIFITTYLPIGATLFEKVNPSRVIFAYPTIVVLGFAFSVITLSIAFSLFLFLNLAVFGTLGWLVYFAGNVISKSHGDFLKHLKDAVLAVSEKKQIVFCNAPAAELFQVAEEKMTGRSFCTGM